jgi:hypothetical protein
VPRLNPKLRRSLIATHRFFGQLVVLVVVLLALTGLALNHDEEFDFLKGAVHWEPLLDWYGLVPKGELVHFSAGDHNAAGLELGLYLDGRYLIATESELIGVVGVQQFLAIATADRLFLVEPMSVDPEAPQGGPGARIFDQMNSASLPGSLTRVGSSRDQKLWVAVQDEFFTADAELLNWERSVPKDVSWSEASRAPEALTTEILREYRGHGLPLIRVLVDLHSGRIFGRHGTWLMDGSAVILLLLVLTGILGSGLGRRRKLD